MNALIDCFIQKHPEHAARILNTATAETVLSIFEEHPEHLEDLICNMSPTFIAKAFQVYPKTTVSALCTNISPPYLATILRHWDKLKRNEIIDELQPVQKAIKELLNYSPAQVGYYLENTELVLSETLTAKDAIEIIEQTDSLTQPIYVVDTQYHLIGTIDLFTLIKVRKEKQTAIKAIINKHHISFKASTEIQNIINHPEWHTKQVIPIVGKTNNFLGVISKNILSVEPTETKSEKGAQTALNEYIYFSELLWKGLQRFWGSLR